MSFYMVEIVANVEGDIKMQYKNRDLEMKVLKRKFLREVRENKPVMFLGFVFGIFIGVNFVINYL